MREIIDTFFLIIGSIGVASFALCCVKGGEVMFILSLLLIPTLIYLLITMLIDFVKQSAKKEEE